MRRHERPAGARAAGRVCPRPPGRTRRFTREVHSRRIPGLLSSRAMGEVTTQFATRFGAALELLGGLASDRSFAALRRRHGAALEAAVGEALDAVAAVHETGTEAVKRWSERRAAVLAQVAVVRAALARGGVDAGARREARALVDLVGQPGAEP